ncbi:Aste57867_16939 [Aphanomyces stellatus]|uniref:Aste57867_16939 protein n=1 Tax=Aphanomyces stellatus TaxID=120398 RepID=A0A485L7I6_9STRA|nr:hypothetical protein As57867_016881 [Aphanomyces stellatus]VFT93701.1 Aste57867_16939 [Aphanomyces stellatus]
MTNCARCEARISIFSKKRKCARCSRRICKICAGNGKDEKPNSVPGRTSLASKSFSHLAIPSATFGATGAVPLNRHSTMPSICPLGCHDVKGGAVGDDDGHRLSGTGEMDCPPPSPIELSPVPSPNSDRGGSVLQAPMSAPAVMHIEAIPGIAATAKITTKEAQTQRMIDAATGFLVSFWLCMLWSVVSHAVVQDALFCSPVGLGACAVVLGTVYSARGRRRRFKVVVD